MDMRDTRIVEMQFDNSKFDRNIAKSKKTLADFKAELDFDNIKTGIEKVTELMQKIDLSKVTDNIQKLTDKFTGLGNVTEYVMSRIRYSIENAALQLEYFIKDFTMAQVSVGQFKYDNLNKAVQTIVATGKYSEAAAYETFDRLMKYTDQTSYSFSDMVGQISLFTALNMPLKESEKAMEGIANQAAKAGQGVSQASAAMDAYSKAMALGHLGTIQFDTLARTAHVVTAEWRQTLIDTAVETGTLIKKNEKYFTKKGNKQVSADSLEQTLKYNWADKNTLMAFNQKYYWQYLTDEELKEALDSGKITEEELKGIANTAYKSAQRALTFSDAINAIKESVSSGWMQSFRLIFGDLTEAMELFTGICDKVIDGIYGIQEARNAILEKFGASGGRKTFWSILFGNYKDDAESEAYGFLDVLFDIGDMISNVWWDAMRNLLSPSEKVLWDEDPDKYRPLIMGAHLSSMVDDIAKFVQSIKGFFNDEITIGEKTTTRMEMIKHAVDGIVAIVMVAMDVIGNVIKFFSRVGASLEPGARAIAASFSNIGEKLYGLTSETKEADSIGKFFDSLYITCLPMIVAIDNAAISIANLINTIVEFADQTGLFDFIVSFISNSIKIITWLISGTIGDLSELTGETADLFRDMFENGINDNSVDTFAQGFVNAIAKTVISITDRLGLIFEEIGKLLTPEKCKQIASDLSSGLKKVAKAFVDAMPESTVDVQTALRDLFGLWEDPSMEDPNSTFVKLRKTIEGSFSGIGEFIIKFLENINGIGEKFQPAINAIAAITNSITNLVNAVVEWGNNSGLFSIIGEATGTIITTIIDAISTGFGKIGTFFSKIADMVAELFRSNFSQEGLAKFGADFMALAKQTVNDILTELPETFSGIVSGVKDLFGLWDDPSQGDPDSFFSHVREFFTNGFSGIFQYISNFFSNFKGPTTLIGLIKEKIFGAKDGEEGEAFDLEGFIYKAFGIAGTAVGLRAIDWIKNVAKEFCWAIEEIAESFKAGFKVQYNDYGQYYLAMAKAIAIIVALVVVLSTIDLGAMAKGIGALITILTLIWAFDKAMRWNGKAVSLLTGSAQVGGAVGGFAYLAEMLGIAIVVLSFAVMILPLALIPEDMLKKGLLTIVAIVAIVLVAVLAITGMSKMIKPDSVACMFAIAAVVIAIGFAVTLMMAPLIIISLISNFCKPYTIETSLIVIAALIFMLATTVEIMAAIPVDGKAIGKVVLMALIMGVLAFSLTIAIIPFLAITAMVSAFGDDVVTVAMYKLAGLIIGFGALVEAFAWIKLDAGMVGKAALLSLIIGAMSVMIFVAIIPLLALSWAVKGFGDDVVTVAMYKLMAIMFIFGTAVEVMASIPVGVGAIAKVALLTLVMGEIAVALLVAMVPLLALSWMVKSFSDDVVTVAMYKLIAIMFIFGTAVEVMASIPVGVGAIAKVALLTLVMGEIAIALLVAMIPLLALSWMVKGFSDDVVTVAMYKLMAMMFIFGTAVEVMASIPVGVGAIAKVALLTLIMGEMAIALLVTMAPLWAMVALVNAYKPNVIQSAFINIVALLFVFGTAVEVLALIPLEAGAVAKVAVLTVVIIGLSIALSLILGALTIFTKFGGSVWSLIEAVIGMAILMAVMVGVVDSLSELKPVKFSNIIALFFVTTAANAMIGSIEKLAKYDFGKLMGAILGLVIIMAALGAFVWWINRLGGETGEVSVKMAGILGLALSISLLALSLWIISFIPTENMLTTIIYFIAIIAGLSLLINLINGCSFQEQTGAKIMSYVIIAFSIAVLAGALFVLSLIPAEKLSATLIAFVTVVIAFYGLIAIISTLGPSIKAAVSSLLMAISMAAIMMAFAYALTLVKDFDPALVMAFAAGIAQVIVAVVVSIAALGIIPLPMVIQGVLTLSAAITVLIGVLTLMLPGLISAVGNSIGDVSGKLIMLVNSISTFATTMGSTDESNIDKASAIFAKLKTVLESITGFGKYTDEINAYTTCLFDLAAGTWLFTEISKDIGDPSNNHVFTLADIISKNKDKFKDLDTYNYVNNLAYLAAGLGLFDYITKELEVGKDTPSIKLLQDLAGCASNLKIIEGFNTNKLAGNLSDLGGALYIYAKGAKEAAGLEGEASIDENFDIAPAIRLLVALSDALAKEVKDGKFNIPELPEEKEFDTYGARLAALAIALDSFAKASQGFGSGTSEALAALQFLTDIRQKLTDQTKEALTFFKDKNISEYIIVKFAVDIYLLGRALSAFAASTSKISFWKMTSALGYLDSFTTIKEKLNSPILDIPGVIKWFGRNQITETNLVQFGKDIGELGNALSKFATSVDFGESKGTNVDDAVKVLEKIAGLHVTVSKEITIDDALGFWKARHKDLNDLSAEIIELGGALNTFGTKVNGEDHGDPYDPEKAKAAVGSLDTIFDTLNTICIKMPMVEGALNKAKGFFTGREFDTGDLTSIVIKLGEALGSFGNDLGSNFMNKDQKDNVVSFLKDFTDILATFSTLPTDQLYSLDKYASALESIIYRLAYGSGQFGANGEKLKFAEIVAQLASDISEAMSKFPNIDAEKLDIFRVLASSLKDFSNLDLSFDFAYVGTCIAQGVALGITNGTNMVTNSAINMAVSAYNAAMAALSASSPSKLFMDVGSYVSSGFAIGIDSGVNRVYDSTYNMADEAVEGASDGLKLISDVMLDDGNFNPTITPVVDMTNVTNSMNELDRMIDNRQDVLDTSYAANLAAKSVPQRSSSEQNQNAIDFSGIYEKFNELRNELGNLGTQIGNMKLILNTGVVAGGITDQVDLNLGRKMLYSERNN